MFSFFSIGKRDVDKWRLRFFFKYYEFFNINKLLNIYKKIIFETFKSEKKRNSCGSFKIEITICLQNEFVSIFELKFHQFHWSFRAKKKINRHNLHMSIICQFEKQIHWKWWIINEKYTFLTTFWFMWNVHTVSKQAFNDYASLKGNFKCISDSRLFILFSIHLSHSLSFSSYCHSYSHLSAYGIQAHKFM